MYKLNIALLLFLFASTFAFSQDKKKDEWNVSEPPYAHKNISFTTDEGTWMNLDVSPSGNTIVFDMLGDIYSMPITGGTAKVLRSGLPFEVQPRFSPDGQKILFTSDAGGGDNIWVMDTDGQNAKQLTKEKFRLLNNPAWSPDGQYFVARKHFTSTRSAGAGEIWMYHISGGAGVQLTKRKNDQQDVNEPVISADGNDVYFSEDMYPGGFFQYNKDPNDQIYAIKKYDRSKGTTETILGGPGGACRPQLSNASDRIAYVRRVRSKTVLFVYNLDTGEDFPIWDGLAKDQQEAWAIFGAYTGFDWMPDDKAIVIWGQGKIWKVDATSGKATQIPFSVTAEHKLAETTLFKQKVHKKEFSVKAIRHTITSPDESMIIFNAAGYLWKKKLPNGKPKRLTKASDEFEFEPSFSPDGRELVYVSWNDENFGTINKLNVQSGQATQISKQKGIYRTPQYSQDGQQIVYRKESGNGHQGFTYSVKPGIYTMDKNGDDVKFVHKAGENPRFNTAGDRIFIQKGGYLFGSLKKSYVSVDLNGEDERVIFNTKYTNQFVPSPDNKWIAFTELHKAYIAPMPAVGQPFGLTADTKVVPVSQVARDAGISLHWSSDSKKIHWTIGESYFTNEIKDRFTFLSDGVDSIPPLDTTGIQVGLTLETDTPDGMIALTNATIITMKGDEVIENGTILIEGNVIKEIGSAKDIKVPGGAATIDCEGKTIMPGIIDVHAHLGAFRYGLSPQKHWQYFANLAYGVTTTHDPSSNTEMTFSQSEMVKAGHMIGPRIYSTGTILYGADGDFKAEINSLEDARSALRRTKAFGAFSVKSYNQPRREQRQQIIKAAKEMGINVYPEGGSHYFHNMSMVADGHTSVEHNIPVAPLYNDVIQFWSNTKTGNTPTLIVNYGGVNGEFYWYQKTNVWEKERLLSFTPRPLVDSRSRHRTMIPDEEYENGHLLTSKSCTKLQNAGVNMHLGSHGQLQGLGAHWELWMLQQGGMSNHQALKAATIQGANYIGMDDEIGSLEKGKLADLIVLEKNPLEDIQNSEFVQYTMINGRLYDAATMNEIGNEDIKRSKFYWELEGSGNAYPFYQSSSSFMKPQCHCRL